MYPITNLRRTLFRIDFFRVPTLRWLISFYFRALIGRLTKYFHVAQVRWSKHALRIITFLALHWHYKWMVAIKNALSAIKRRLRTRQHYYLLARIYLRWFLRANVIPGWVQQIFLLFSSARYFRLVNVSKIQLQFPSSP